MANFWISEGIKVVVFLATSFALGRWVMQRGIKVNYTRKILHFIFFFFPISLTVIFPYEPTKTLTLLSGCILIACIGLMYQPIREKSVFLSTAFLSVDRPEDRPYTLIWLITQFIATYLVLVVMVAWLERYDKSILIFITFLVAGLGDGLAEPVGVRFGKHAYKTHALFTKKKFTRTVEGSLCVFFSGILAIILMASHLSQSQLILALLIIPIAMTLAEALSPHTWDSPFLYLVGGTTTVLVLELSQFRASA